MGRPKLIEDEELLSAAREVFVEQGIGASTREIAAKAGISEAVIFQRHRTKADLFFAAMVPPALDVEALIGGSATRLDTCERLEEIAIGMVRYFREVMPILLPLVSHPSFDFERFAEQHPDSPMSRLRGGLVQFLESEQERGAIESNNVGAVGLTLVATAHSLALFERLGVHGGHFTDEMIRGIARVLWDGLSPAG